MSVTYDETNGTWRSALAATPMTEDEAVRISCEMTPHMLNYVEIGMKMGSNHFGIKMGSNYSDITEGYLTVLPDGSLDWQGPNRESYGEQAVLVQFCMDRRGINLSVHFRRASDNEGLGRVDYGFVVGELPQYGFRPIKRLEVTVRVAQRIQTVIERLQNEIRQEITGEESKGYSLYA